MAHPPYPFSDRELVGRISRSAGGRAGYKQLVRELGLGGGRQRRLLVEQLTRMVARGDLSQPTKDFWALPKAPVAGAGIRSDPSSPGSRDSRPSRDGRDRLLAGRLDLHRDGFGFVRLEAASSVSQRTKLDGQPEPDRSRSSGSAGHRPGLSATRPGEDIFIPPQEMNGAMQGDLVLVDEASPGRDGRRSGRIARVLTRRNPTIVGIFHYARAQKGHRYGGDATPLLARGNYVTPLDERMGGPVEIPEGAEELPKATASLHRTLSDEEVELRRTWTTGGPDAADLSEKQWPLEGLAVDVEITAFPQSGRPAQGRLIEVLGPPDAFGVDVEIVIRKHHIPHTFPPAVLAEASDRAVLSPATLSVEERSAREDFRGLPIVTIDGETARDFDDAVLVRPLPNGHTELQVHIADVSSYVLPGSALDTEARVRGNSVYFPDRAVPMLPHALSSGMCSLRPDEDRLALSCVMEIDPQGEVARFRLAEGLIRSVRRCTYTSVQQCLNASPEAALWNAAQSASGDSQKRKARPAQSVTPEPTAEDFAERERVALEHPALAAAFAGMLELALRLNAKRVRRGSIDFDLPEPVVQFDPEGNMRAIVRSERGWAHRLIEEFMLSANECVASWLKAQGVPAIYRIHEVPDPKRIVEFEETAAGFGQSLGIGALPVRKLTMKADRRETRQRSAQGSHSRAPKVHEIPASIPVTPQMYQRLVRRIAGTPEERILSYLMLRSLKQARYAEKNEGHFALASPSYTHFTSPIRRYPDLVVHRLVREMLRRGADPRGGPIRSGDRQPWHAELERVRGPHASQKNGAGLAPLLAETSAADKQLAAADLATTKLPTAELATTADGSYASGSPEPAKADKRSSRAGRVGWSTDAAGSGSPSRPVVPVPPRASEEEPRSPHRVTLSLAAVGEPVSAEELSDIAVESSQAERRAADAERELIEWKKIKFMADKVGDDFGAMILSVTKYGFFVELDELFIEGLVPLASLTDDHYSFRDTDRSICGARTGHCFQVGQHVHVLLDRIDRQARRLQFALLPGTEPGRSPHAGRETTGGNKSQASSQKPLASSHKAKRSTQDGKRKKKRSAKR